METLKFYLQKTAHLTDNNQGPVFLTLKPPFEQISASTVASILNEAIALAGVSQQGYSAKCFRPSAAQHACDSGVSPDVIQQLGRWKTRSVMLNHYVNSTAVAQAARGACARGDTLSHKN